ncbi:TetR/AcrR family transcriptional regulator [Pseudonocardia sp. NPDC049635]|uniref:TetR/AcrR family transcriptional regulator n=1 Tax=Pseudonocardia sp. NPDC049635 TaxID=3155506 RepID=UPI0033CE4C7A
MGDRRAERHQATVDEIVEAAWRLARTSGLAAFSLRELAGEVGMRPQSLYSYFESKHAIYDAMYAQGCRQFVEGQASWTHSGDAVTDLQAIGRFFVDFCTQDPVRYQLMFQRTIPGFEPSEGSFAISVESLDSLQAHLVSLGIDDPAALDLFTALTTGIADQQISNDPGGDRWVRLIDDAVEMFWNHVTSRAAATTQPAEETRE